MRVRGWFDWGARPGAECGRSVFPAQGHKKRVSGGQNLCIACAKRLLGEVRFAFRIGRLTPRCGWKSFFLRIRIGRLTSRCGSTSVFLRLVVARCQCHVCKCNLLRVSCTWNRSRCSAVSILVHLAASPQMDAETCVRRHGSSSSVADVDSRDMDLRIHRCIRTLRHRCGDMDPETWNRRHGSCRGS